MSEVMEFEADQNDQENEVQEMGSLNHSFVQARLTTLLSGDDRFTTMVELSLDASQIDLSQFGLKVKDELKPDVCIYPKGRFGVRRLDLLRVPEMPLLAIEIISPKQGINDILTKFEGYFALGVKSCWLVMPAIQSITVYSQTSHKTFADDGEVVDKVLDIRLPLQKVFTE